MLTMARATWLLIAALATVTFILQVPARIGLVKMQLSAYQAGLEQLGLSGGFVIAYASGIDVITMLAFSALALLVFIRRSHDPVAMLVSIAFVLHGVNQPLYFGQSHQPIELAPPLSDVPLLLSGLGFSLGVISLFIFPDGRFVPRWSRAAAVLVLAWSIGWTLVPALTRFLQAAPLGYALQIAWYAIGCAALTHRYHAVARPEQRDQIRWILYGAACTLVAWSGYALSLALWPPSGAPDARQILRELASATLLAGSMLLLPTAFAIAIVRHRLWDIGLIINRTLVYLPLTGIVAGLYSAVITALQRLFVWLTGTPSDTAVVLTTLLIAATFSPIKKVLEQAADRHFKEAPDHTRRLQALANHVRSVVNVFDAYRVTEELLDEAARAFNAPAGAVYLAVEGEMALVHKRGQWHAGQAAIAVPLRTNGSDLGVLELAARAGGAEYSAHDREVLEAAAAEVARAIELAPMRAVED